MAKTFKNGLSLHRLLESAPLERLQPFLTTVDQGQMAAIFASLPWDDARVAGYAKDLAALATLNALRGFPEGSLEGETKAKAEI